VEWLEQIRAIYSCCPDNWQHVGLGLTAALARMALDDRMCNLGLGIFFGNLAKQFFVSFVVVAVLSGVLAHHHITGVYSSSIMLMAGFYAREFLEHGRDLAEHPKKAVELWKKFRGLVAGK